MKARSNNETQGNRPPSQTLPEWLGRPERLSLVLLVVSGGAALLFLRLSNAVVRGATQAFDEKVLLAFRAADDVSNPLGPIWFEELMRDITALGGNGFVFLTVAVFVGFLAVRGQWRAALFLLAAVLGGLLLSLALKESFHRPRPNLVPHGQAIITASFPSMHSVMATSGFLTIAVLVGRMIEERSLRVYFLAVGLSLAVLVGISRIYLGVHWPTDVIAGWVLGGGWSLLCLYVARLLQRRRVLENPQ